MKLQIAVEAGDPATASRQAQALERLLLEEGPPATIERVRTNDETLDGGATLAVILASPVLPNWHAVCACSCSATTPRPLPLLTSMALSLQKTSQRRQPRARARMVCRRDVY